MVTIALITFSDIDLQLELTPYRHLKLTPLTGYNLLPILGGERGDDQHVQVASGQGDEGEGGRDQGDRQGVEDLEEHGAKVSEIPESSYV